MSRSADDRNHDQRDDRTVEHERVRETHHEVSPDAGKTSAAATFALIFGLSALLCALTLFLSPFAVLFGLIALVLGVVGMKMAKRPLVTGKTLAISGLIMGVLGLLLGIGLLAGLGLFLNNDTNVERIENQLQQFRDQLPTELPSAP
ncbi:MAG: hypothetical protein ACR2MA_08665 [Egibacteraceae bacterium]